MRCLQQVCLDLSNIGSLTSISELNLIGLVGWTPFSELAGVRLAEMFFLKFNNFKFNFRGKNTWCTKNTMFFFIYPRA